jgi:hypothetical protein
MQPILAPASGTALRTRKILGPSGLHRKIGRPKRQTRRKINVKSFLRTLHKATNKIVMTFSSVSTARKADYRPPLRVAQI